MSKIVVFLLEDFELIEATATIDILRRAGLELNVVSLFDEDVVKSHQGLSVLVDKKYSEISIKDYDVLVLPGGYGTYRYEEKEGFMDVLRESNEKSKIIASICAAPYILAKSGILKSKKATCYPSVTDILLENGAIITNDSVVVDTNIITAKSASKSIDFALEIVSILLGEAKKEELKKSIIY